MEAEPGKGWLARLTETLHASTVLRANPTLQHTDGGRTDKMAGGRGKTSDNKQIIVLENVISKTLVAVTLHSL